MSGKLFIIGTPIGNLKDISRRTIDALEECSLLFVEDTRVTIKLLNHLGLNIKMLSCHKHNERERLSDLEKAASENLVCGLISDAGMPLVSDPGSPLLSEALRLEMEVVPIPGPTAFVLALVASGLPLDSFVFEGFLPDETAALKERLATVATEKRTMVFYVSPHKLSRTLSSMLAIFGDRPVCLARELTKKHEEIVRMSLTSLEARYRKEEARGELVLVVGGASQVKVDYSDWLEDEDKRAEIMTHVQDGVSAGLKLSRAAALSAEYFKLSRGDIYREALQQKLLT